MTAPYAEVIGDPVAHSKSPALHRFWLDALGLPGTYHARRTNQEALGAYLRERRGGAAWRGCNVTMPLKEAIIPHLADLDAGAAQAGAVNLVGPDLVGHNSDLIAIRDMVTSDRVPADAVVRVVGTGGAARAAAAGLLAAGVAPSSIVIHGRDVGKASELARTVLGKVGQAGSIAGLGLADTDLLINASPLGMEGHPPFPEVVDEARVGLRVYDLVYNPIETALLRAARERGLRVRDGLDMLIGQAAASFALFFGAEPPRDRDAELRERLLR